MPGSTCLSTPPKAITQKVAKAGFGVRLTDKQRHGLVNGGHTFATILDAAKRADEEQLANMRRAQVRIHVMRGLDADTVVEIAQGLNRSKQVKDTSLRNLDNQFDAIKQAMKRAQRRGPDRVLRGRYWRS